MKTYQLIFAFLLSGIILFGEASAQQKTNVKNLEQISSRQNLLYQQRTERVKEYATEHGIEIRKVFEDGSIIELVDVVNGQPVFYKTDNLWAATTTRANQLWQGGSLGVSIEGLNYDKIGIWDGGAVRQTHQEFTNTGQSRVAQADGATSLSSHATHVAGTIMAGGVNANAKGMAFRAQLKANDWNNVESEMAAAAAAGMEISNHSWGYITGWNYNQSSAQWEWYGNGSVSANEDYLFGFYNAQASLWDQIAYNAPYFLITKSAGNDRGDGPSNAGTNGLPEKDGGADGFDCIGGAGNAKNVLTVGAVNEVTQYNGPGSVVMSSFSSWGPTDDGRIKPDIVAKGVNTFSSVADANDAYASYNGTSMSSPNATGSMILLQQLYQSLNNGTPMLASTLKALVIHTADEAGPSPGPDYMFGWGLMNTERAASMIIENSPQNTLIAEETLQPLQVFEEQIQAIGTEPLKVTLCWTDVNAAVPAGMLNNRNTVLVHDLNLAIIDDQSQIHYPYQLNPEQPASPATNVQKNNVDNVEQVFIPNASGSYILRITHDGNLLSAQDFSIIISGASAHEDIPLCSAGLTYPVANSQSNPVNLTIAWDAAPYATAYHVFFGSNGEGIQTPGNIHNGTIVNENALAVTLDTNTNYYLQILPQNSYGINTACSEIWSFKTATANEFNFPPPTNLSASVNMLNVSLNWGPPQFSSNTTNRILTGAQPAMILEMAPSAESDYTKGIAQRLPQGTKSFSMENVLYDNGPFINSLGTGPDGTDESILQNSSLGMSTLGMGVQYLSGNRMADEFMVTSSWGIDNIVVFAYQTGSPPSSSMTEAYLQIWDDNPMNGGSIIWGDLLSNRLASTGWTNTYRLSQTTPGTTRPIMYLEIATDGLMLEPGTYWIDFSLVGSLSSGPWVPPVTINGETTTGNGLQFQGSNQSWIYFPDGSLGTYQGIPFLVRGNNLGGQFPVSYNIYRDEELIANVPSYQYHYIDEGVAPGSHSYGLSAVYETPELAESVKIYTNVDLIETYLNVSPDSLILNRLSGSFSLSINSNVNWVLPQHQGWLVPETSSGSNNSTLHFTYEANPYTDPRQAIMRFEVPGSSLAKEIFVLQEPTLQLLNIYPLAREINAAAGSVFFYVTSNGSWTLNTGANWLTLTQSSGNASGAFEVIVEQNNTNEVRQAVINILTEDGLESFPVIVAQACESCFAPPQQVTALVTGLEVNLAWEQPSLINSPDNTNNTKIKTHVSPLLKPDVETMQDVTIGSSITHSGANPFSLSQSNANINTRSTYNEWIPIRHDNGANGQGVGLTNGGTFNIATRFSAEELQQYSSHELIQIELFFNEFPAQCVLKVYDEGTIGSPGNQLLSQVVETQSIGWNMFVLNFPVALTGNDLWIGYEITNNWNSYPAGLDSGPAHPDGDWISLDGQNWERLSIYGFNGNWNIVGYLSETGNNISYQPASYNIYKDNTLIGNTASNIKSFVDIVGNPGTFTYGISTVYDPPFGGESNITPLEVIVETPFIAVQPEEQSVTYNNQWMYFEILSNTYWRIENTNDWLTISQQTGSHTQMIDINIIENPMAFDRTGQFTVSSLDGTISVTVTIHQEAAPPDLVLSPDLHELHALAGNISLNLISNTEWQVSTTADWLTISPETGIGNSSIRIDFEANETNAIRSAMVTATSLDGTLASSSQIAQSTANNFLPPANLTGNAVGYQVQLSWDAPSLTTTSIIFAEDFENESFPPEGWGNYDVDAGATPRFWQSSPAQNKTIGGSLSAFHNYGPSTQNDDGWLVSPAINIPPGNTSILSFWSYNAFPTYYHLGKNSLLVSTSLSEPGAHYTEIWTTASVTTSWEETVINLSAYAGQQIYLAFRYEGADAHVWYLDDISITSSGIQTLPENTSKALAQSDLQTSSDSTVNQAQTNTMLRWDNGVYHQKAGIVSGGTMNIALHFPASELSPFIGQEIEAIEFYIADAPTSCFIKVYQQGPDKITEATVVKQQVFPVANAWNTFILDFPVTIEGPDLYFGYEVTHGENIQPAGYDAGPANSGLGDLISVDGGNSWQTLYSLGINSNWNLAAHLSPVGGTSLYGPSAYKIFRNGTHIETLNKLQKTYSEFHFEEGTHTYAVSAVYDSPPGESDAVPVDITIAISGNNAMPQQHYLPKSGGEVRSVVLNFSSIQVLYNPEWTTVAVEPFNGTTSVHIQYTENTSGQVRTGSVQMSDGSVIVLVQQPENNSLISYFETPRLNQNHQIVFVSDLNEDGRQDMVIKKGEPVSKLDFYIDNGSTQEFLAEIDVPYYTYPYDSESFVKKSNRQELFLTDIDNDGNKDLLVWAANHASCTDNMIKIYWGSNQQPYFDPLDYTVLESSYPYCVGAYAVDFNEDALIDVYIRSASGVNTMYQNFGNRNFGMVSTFNPGRDIEVIFEDVDADGFKDMVYTKNGWADGQWGIRMNKSLGNGDFNSNTHIALHNEMPYDGLIVLQANPQTDNHPDFLIQCSNDGFNTTALYLLNWDELQQSFNTRIFHSGNNPQTTVLHAMDYNNDGFEDIIFRYLTQGDLLRYSMAALINDGDGNFFSSEIIHSGLDFKPLQYFRNEDGSYITGYRDTDFNDALLVIYKTEAFVNPTYLEVTPAYHHNSAAAGNIQLEIASNTHWIVSNPHQWISFDQLNGVNNQTLVAKIEENTLSQSRSGVVTIQTTDGTIVVDITIEQDAAAQNCSPAWSPPSNLQFNMQLVGQILIDGQVSLNPNDVLGAFVGNECRGIASPDPALNGIVFLTIGSNVASGEQVELKIWNSISCSDCNAIPGFEFINQGEIGTFLEPYQVRCGAIQDITFGQGYTWFSLNVNPGSMAPASLFSALTPCYDDRVIGQTSFALYTGSTWVGSLTSLGMDKMYRMKLCNSQSLSLMGEAASLNPINLAAGYTWLGYQPQQCQSVSAAMAGLSPGPSYDDRVIGQSSFALFTGSTWVGSLTQMCPGKGYVIKLANAQTLTYPAGTSKSSTDFSEEIISPTGVYPVEGLQHTMMVVGKLQLNDGSYSNNPNDVIYGFVGEECRGIAIPSNELNGLIFMSIGSNIESGEMVSFKVWIDAAQTLLPLNELISFEAMQSIGGLDNPFLFTLGEMVGVAERTDGIWIGEPYPNPFTKSVSIKLYVNAPTEVAVNLYDPMGAIVYRQSVNYPNAGLYTLDIEPKSTASTLYYLELMISQEKSQTKKYFKIIHQ